MRKLFNFITSDTNFFGWWMLLSTISLIINWNNSTLAEINITQFLIAAGVTAILKRLNKKDEETKS